MNALVVALVIKDFKGIKDLRVEFGHITNILGGNGVGKTTVLDAFNWLLFNKDSLGRTAFEIKPLDENNNPLRGLSPDVEGTLSVNGTEITLRKVYTEKWATKRGETKEQLTGHETTYYVDGVPCKQSEYKDAIARIADEERFRLLTSPLYFNAMLEWKERRQILLALCGEISDEQVIASSAKLAPLPEILNKRSIDDHRKVLAEQKKKLKQDIDGIPTRIDEATLSMTDVSHLDLASIAQEMTALRESIKTQSEKLLKAQNGTEISEKAKRLVEIDTEVSKIRGEQSKSNMDLAAAQRLVVGALRNDIQAIESECNGFKSRIVSIESDIELKKEKQQSLRDNWEKIDDEEFVHEAEDKCPVCQRDLPEDQMAAAHDNALEAFNLSKSKRLELVVKEGKSLQATIESLLAECQSLKTKHQKGTAKLEEMKSRLAAELKKLESLTSADDESEEPKEIVQKLEEYERVSKEIEQLQTSNQKRVDTIKSGITSLETELAAKEADKARVEAATRVQQRIDALKEQEKSLADELGDVDRQVSLMDLFMKRKVTMFESAINSKFSRARFKLFDERLNDTTMEACETTLAGVPWNSLNKAGQIQVGLDIINTLSDHYGSSFPVWLDNRESVIEIPTVSGQIVNLLVPPTFDSLPAETKNMLAELHGGHEEARTAWKRDSSVLRIEFVSNQGGLGI